MIHQFFWIRLSCTAHFIEVSLHYLWLTRTLLSGDAHSGVKIFRKLNMKNSSRQGKALWEQKPRDYHYILLCNREAYKKKCLVSRHLRCYLRNGKGQTQKNSYRKYREVYQLFGISGPCTDCRLINIPKNVVFWLYLLRKGVKDSPE